MKVRDYLEQNLHVFDDAKNINPKSIEFIEENDKIGRCICKRQLIFQIEKLHKVLDSEFVSWDIQYERLVINYKAG